MANGGCKLKIIISKTFKKKRLFHKMPAVTKNYNKIIDIVRMSILFIKIILSLRTLCTDAKLSEL
jgi:hypothetical protein